MTESGIDLHADFRRSLGTIDSLLRELYIGLGCALENLVIAAQASGRTADVQLLPDAASPSLVASVSLTPATPSKGPLFDAIARRHTNRGRYANAPPSAELSKGLPPKFAKLLSGLMGASDRRAQMLFRIGYPWVDALKSPRRPIDWVLL
ncbi:MAG TPA: hypothetical protein VIK01_06300 [Polyangiaceae bacterium]